MWTPRPLVAITIKLELLSLVRNSLKINQLTADIERASESCSDFWVKFDHEILIFSELIIAILNFLGHPLPEVVTYDRVDDIDKPLPRNFMQVPIIRQILLNLRNLFTIFEDGFNS